MKKRTLGRIASLMAAMAALVVALAAAGPVAAAPATAVYEITITNLTGGQPLTPPVVAIHRRPLSLFDLGAPATVEIQEIAENGNLAPMESALDGNRHVYDFGVTDTGPLVPAANPGGTGFADSATLLLESARGAKYLSFASMLICTNDGFTGLDGLRLPKKVGDSTTAYTAGYDAGTEVNTEDFADIVPPCQGLIGIGSPDSGTGMTNPALAQDGVISMHPGIQGGDDLVPGVHGWTDPVASITVTRVD